MRTYGSGSGPSSGRVILVLLAIGLVAAVVMWGGWGALASLTPFLLILLFCSLMHLFMHGGHGGPSPAARDQLPGSGEGHRH